jgi:hypothetical protein
MQINNTMENLETLQKKSSDIAREIKKLNLYNKLNSEKREALLSELEVIDCKINIIIEGE